MFKFLPRFSVTCVQRISNNSGKRYFLSPAYKCSDVWENRLQNKVFDSIDVENLYYQLDLNLKSKARVSCLDIDLFLNTVRDSSFKNEVQDVLFRFRLCPECSILPERATHAAIRWYMDHASKEDLMNVLSDRINFGLFSDYYLSNLLTNNFILQNDFVSAVKIAVLQMLQEDFGNSLNKALALYSCFAYLDSPDVWKSLEPVVSEDNEDEKVQKVRVPFIRNPYFDDHFDITNTNHLVGKTIWMLGTNLEGSLGIPCQLIGLVLYEKYPKVQSLLKEVLESGAKIHLDALERVSNYLKEPPKQPKSEGGENSGTDDSDKVKKEILQLVEEVKSKNSSRSNFLEEVKQFVEKAVKENEKKDIEFQTQLYKKWEEDRKVDIEKEINRQKSEELLDKIKKTKEELELEEEKLFYFDKEDEIKLKLEELEEEKKSVKFWKGSKKGKIKEEDDYIPPDVHQRPS